MLKKKMMLLLLPFLVLLLIGCSSKEVVTEYKYVKQVVPQELLTCKDIKKPENIAMQSDVALFVIDLYDTATDCNTKLKEIKNIIDNQQ